MVQVFINVCVKQRRGKMASTSNAFVYFLFLWCWVCGCLEEGIGWSQTQRLSLLFRSGSKENCKLLGQGWGAELLCFETAASAACHRYGIRLTKAVKSVYIDGCNSALMKNIAKTLPYQISSSSAPAFSFTHCPTTSPGRPTGYIRI